MGICGIAVVDYQVFPQLGTIEFINATLVISWQEIVPLAPDQPVVKAKILCGKSQLTQ